MDIKIPAPAEEIISRLNENGYEAYVVGGCVRDMLLGREPEDWDITTSALPEQVKQVFRRTIDTGIQHGTVTVMADKEGYEVTTYRIDGEYSDGRHPNSVEFTSNLVEDLKRRDFTVNAMAYSGRTGFVDEFGGVEDLKRGIIRCVGAPMDRFTEDALRILRAIRFSAQLGFSIERHTYEAIKVIAPNMVHVSKERIQVELTKLLLSSHPGHMALVYGTGISPYVSEAFHRAYAGETDGVGIGDQAAVIPFIPTAVRPQKHMRWAAFLRKCTPDQAVGILRELKLDNDTMNRVRTLVTWQGIRMEPDKRDIRLMMSRMEPNLFDDLLELKLCLAKAAEGMEPGLPHGWTADTPYKRTADTPCTLPDEDGILHMCSMETRPETVEELLEIKVLADEIRLACECISLKTLAVRGHDIIAAGVKPGKEVGQVLARLLEMVLEEPERNSREYLLEHLK